MVYPGRDAKTLVRVFLYHVTPTHIHILCSHRPSYYILKL